MKCRALLTGLAHHCVLLASAALRIGILAPAFSGFAHAESSDLLAETLKFLISIHLVVSLRMSVRATPAR